MVRWWMWMVLLGLIVPYRGYSDSKDKKIIVDDFSEYEVNSFPEKATNEWRIFSLADFKTKNYWVVEEGGNKFLRAQIPKDLDRKQKAITIIKRLVKSQGENGKKEFYEPKDYPYLSWRWRVHRLPNGSDERIEDEQTKKSDSAAGIYIYFQKDGRSPNIIKYVWSEVQPVGERFISPASKDIYVAHIVVLKSGAEGLGEWVWEKVNIIEDFKKEFGTQAPPRILGVGILTDADSTNTEAAADYDDIVLSSD